MSAQHSVGVVIMGYGCRDTVQDACKSAQDARRLIVLDGGEPYEVSGERTLWYRDNEGVSYARNYGAKVLSAEGCEWLVFLDGDDWLEEGWVERALSVAGDGDVVYGDVVRHREGDFDGLVVSGSYSEDRLRRGNYIPVTALVRGTAFLGFDKDMRDGLEDYDLWLRMAKAGCKFKYDPALRLHVRVRDDGKTLSMDREGKFLGVKRYLKAKHGDWYRGYTEW